MKLSAIVVTDLNWAIGKNNQLLCHLPADLQFFKRTTMGHPLLMGRKTHESIGRVLPGRRNLIITRNSGYKVEGAEIYSSIENAIAACKNEEKVFVIGGAEIYKQTFSHLHEIYRTLVQNEFEADAFFPQIKLPEWKLNWEEAHGPDEKNKFHYSFQQWVRE